MKASLQSLFPFLFVLTLFLSAPAFAETETLEQAWATAYQNNPSLQAERASLRATDEEVAQAQSHWRPSIDATASAGKTYQYAPSEAPFGLANFAGTTRGAGIQLTQPLFRGFRTDSETEAAENKVFAGRAELTAAEEQLFLDSGTAFLDVVRDESLLDLQHENEHVLEGELKETQTRAKVGDLTKTDVAQAESRLERAHVARYQAESTFEQDCASYERLVGHRPDHLQPPHLTADEGRQRDEILHRADTRNPKVIAAQYAEDEAGAEIDLNKGSLLPEIDLVGNSSRNFDESSTLPGRFDSSQILIQLTMPLYRAGTDYSKTRAAEQTATQKRMELEEARHKAHETAANAWEALQIAKAALKADQGEIDASSRAYEGVKVEQRVGARTMLDVLNAEQELLDAKIDQTKAQHDRDVAILQISDAIGDLTVENINLPVKAYDPTQHYNDVRNQWVGFSRDDADYGVPPESEASAQADAQ